MTDAEAGDAGDRRKLRQEATRQRLLEAAVAVVGESGYSNSSVARITAAAGIAHGTFYNYFDSQQALFDALLPHLGQLLLEEIRAAIGTERDFWRREEIGFRAFFGFVHRRPQFYRILNEAETFAPAGYRQHIANMEDGYRRAVRRGIRDGAVRPLGEVEVEAVVLTLLAARSYLCMRYAFAGPLPALVATAYMDLVRHGLEPAGDGALSARPVASPVPPQAPPAECVWNVLPTSSGTEEPTFEGLLAFGAVACDAGGLTRALAEFSLAAMRAMPGGARDVAVVATTLSIGAAAQPAFGSILGTLARQSADTWVVHADMRGPGGHPVIARGTCTLRLALQANPRPA